MTLGDGNDGGDARFSGVSPASVLLIGLASLLAGIAAYTGVAALVSGSLSTRFHLGRSAPPMYPTPLHGTAAVFGGVSLIALAVSILSICATYPPLAARLPAWTRRFRWWLFATSMALYFAAMYVQRI
jgi:hypothetical protein